jgi:hypothetical protein
MPSWQRADVAVSVNDTAGPREPVPFTKLAAILAEGALRPAVISSVKRLDPVRIAHSAWSSSTTNPIRQARARIASRVASSSACSGAEAAR